MRETEPSVAVTAVGTIVTFNGAWPAALVIPAIAAAATCARTAAMRDTSPPLPAGSMKEKVCVTRAKTSWENVTVAPMAAAGKAEEETEAALLSVALGNGRVAVGLDVGVSVVGVGVRVGVRGALTEVGVKYGVSVGETDGVADGDVVIEGSTLIVVVGVSETEIVVDGVFDGVCEDMEDKDDVIDCVGDTLADCDGVTELVIVVDIVTDDVAEIAAPEIVTLRI